jgi:hypothetical protein
MAFFLDLFTPKTWVEFRKSGAKVTGFRDHHWTRAGKAKPGDVFLCYLVGAKRWVGLLEIASERSREESRIWTEELFPVRFKVKPLTTLDAEIGVPMEDLRGKLSFFPDSDEANWSGRVRGSLSKYSDEDGATIAAAIRACEKTPVKRAIDPKLLERSANLYRLRRQTPEGEEVETVVAVPSAAEEDDTPIGTALPTGATHTEIQFRLLEVGSRMGLKIWAPRSDRNRQWNGRPINSIKGLLDSLPTQFDEVTNQTIENIDVLWLSGNAIVAAFEVEHSTSIYSGLLRMSDLLTMQPNINIDLYLVAPDERYAKFKREVPRPTFASRHNPVHKVCGFVPYTNLCEMLDRLSEYLDNLKPDFIKKVAVYYDPREDYVS